MRTIGPYLRCSEWIYSVRCARNSCHLNIKGVKRERKGPGRLHNGDEKRLQSDSSIAHALATKKTSGNDSIDMTGSSEQDNEC